MEEIYRRYRPTLLKHVLGQDDAIRTLNGFLKNGGLPHALLLSGGSGVGKTTIARILKEKINCSDTDFVEINCADFRGIDTVREIRSRMGLAPMSGGCRAWLLDEVHRASSDAMSGLLKLLEDTPKHVYFFLCTTNPEKLLRTIHTRCTEIKLSPLSQDVLNQLVQDVLGKEKAELTQEVVDRLVEVAEGSARKALVILNQIIGLDGEQEQLDAIQKSDSRRQSIELCRALLNPRTKWPEIATLLKGLVDEEPEGIRRAVLGYASGVMLGGKGISGRAYQLLISFENNLFDSGRSGLVRACYEVVNSPSK